jgi:predicted nucleotidyltransferase
MFSSAPGFELAAGLVVERALDGRPGRRRRVRTLARELAEERLRRDAARFLPGRRSHGPIGGDDRHGLTAAVLGCETLKQIVRVLGEAHLERADGRALAEPVEDDDAARSLQRDVAGQTVGQLPPVAKAARVEQVVSVEEVEHVAKDAHVDTEAAYLDELTARLRAVLGDDLVGIYVGGSYALGAYESGRSDLDVAALVRGPLSAGAVDAIVAALRHESLPTPARKLELVVYDTRAAQSSSVRPSFELNLNTGAREPLRADTEPQPGEEHWFAIDRSVLASHGVALYGPPAAEVFAAPPREQLLPILAGVLRWYLRNEPESLDGVLNAGRSLHFAREGTWIGKPAAREWARTQEGTVREILTRAIAELEVA